jgi:DNA-binding transcriptional regulator YdaS (Cro superfamily)
MNFEQYINEAGLSLTETATALKKPVSTVHGWISGRRLPRAADLAAIEEFTNGAVTARDFVPTVEAA